MKKVEKYAKLHILILVMSVVFLGMNARAEGTVVMEPLDQKFENDILSSLISIEDKQLLLNDGDFKDQYSSLLEDGWELQDISVEECEIDLNDANDISDSLTQTFATTTTRRGKVVTSAFVQRQKTTKKYNNKVYSSYTKVKSLVSFGASLFKGKIAWVASTLFSIDTSDYAPFFNTGYQRVVENGTLHLKDAYYKEGKKYWIGYCAKKLYTAGTVSTYYKDRQENPHRKSRDYNKTFTSKSYNKSNTELVQLARKHYRTGWVNEKVADSQTIRVY